MAKHSIGKHGKPKTGGIHSFGRKGKDQATENEAEESNGSSKAEAAKGAHVGAHAAHAQKADASESSAAEEVEEAAAVEGESGNASDAANDAPQAESTDEQPGEPTQEGAAAGAFMSSSDILAGKKAKRKKIAKRIGISVVSVIGVAAAVYFVGVAVFSTHFMPNTHIQALDLSFKTPEEVQGDFDSKVGDYAIKVKGNGLNIAFTSKQAGLQIDSAGMTEAIADSQDPWKWPVEIFEDKDMTSAMTDSLTASTLADVVNAAVAEVNATAKDPVNAYIDYDPAAKAFAIIPEVPGTKLNAEEVLADILLGAMNLDEEVIILDDDLVEPDVYRDDKRLNAALASANDIVETEIPLVIGGTEAYKVTADDIHGWVSITPEFNAVLDDAAMMDWSEDLASQFNTVGTTRTYTRPDGKEITVSGGDYGWKVDQAALATAIADAIKGGVSGVIEVPVLQGGSGYSTVGGKDWGNRYVDVDISEQYARFYDENGTIIWEAPIVSGATSGGRATPYGVYDVNLKGRHVTLTGRDSAGNITYQTPVAYWMPFIGNSIGFHDATWQSSFGGNRYRTGAGSHGCINLSLSKAEELYGILDVGDVVVVHS